MAQDIHEAVQERYGNIVERVDAAQQVQMASCCGDSAQDSAADCCGPQLYDPQLIEDLPVDVTSLSLGCGDPVSIASLREGETVLDLGSGGGIDCFLSAGSNQRH